MAGDAEAPVATSAVLMSAAKHIGKHCARENRAFLDCKRADENPESCLDKGEQVSRCVVSLLKELNGKCPKAFNAYVKCMDYRTNEFDLCRKEQAEFEKQCPL
eukprot:TRINITY_DN18847_c0_g1_i1.p1 TRINITY_DN18847_c0_g1~~TRINITY_DN18847_c0_g1_i1.p1  ORF type:complete len:103 (+),score=11.52 TRINITY_DN18847_c0_g1_i1:378-686(+)